MSRLPSLQKRGEWRQRLLRFERSKLPVAESCGQEQMSVPSFYHWRKRLANGEPDKSRQASEPATFIPVQVTTVSSLHVSELVVRVTCLLAG